MLKYTITVLWSSAVKITCLTIQNLLRCSLSFELLSYSQPWKFIWVLTLRNLRYSVNVHLGAQRPISTELKSLFPLTFTLSELLFHLVNSAKLDFSSLFQSFGGHKVILNIREIWANEICFSFCFQKIVNWVHVTKQKLLFLGLRSNKCLQNMSIKDIKIIVLVCLFLFHVIVSRSNL